jgi:hypothetical protein
MNVEHIIGAATITTVWRALGGPEPKRGRAPAFYRDGDNPQAVSLNDGKGCWFDYRDNKGGGVLDLIQHVRGGDRGAALRWLADLNGVPLDDQPATYVERRAFAERRESEQRDMRAAEFFRIAAVSLADHLLDDVLPEAVPERYAPTQLRLTLKAAQGAVLLAIYRDFRAREPRLTAGLVYAGERSWDRLCTRLAKFVAAGMEVPDVT